LTDERGYSLVEMLVVMAILGVVISGLTTVFVSGSRAELDMNRRFQAQQQARLALDRFRADLHCASAAQVQTINSYTGSIAISAPNCTTATIDWCLVPSPHMTGRYALYRTVSTTNKCASADTAPARRRLPDHEQQRVHDPDERLEGFARGRERRLSHQRQPDDRARRLRAEGHDRRA
jgi:prepilin-type N-terminal cleavage/methylation domain-containing protein